MKPITLKIIIILVAVAIVAPSGYYAYQYFNKSNQATTYDPMDYIPGNSTFISTVNHNNSLYYIFYDNNSFGIVLNASSNNIINNNYVAHAGKGNSTPTGSNSSSNISLTSSTYKGVTVFEAKNVSLGLILSEFTGNKNVTNATVNLYFYVISDKYVVMGEHNAINYSIIANKDNKNAHSLTSYINTNQNLSMYYSLKNKSLNVNYITVNSTHNNTYINVTPYNMAEFKLELSALEVMNYTKLTNVSGGANITGISNITNINISKPVITVNKNNVTIKMDVGFNNLITILKSINIKK